MKPGRPVAVIGTLFKEMKLKPNILNEFTNERSVGVGPPKIMDNYCAEDDVIVLEDTSGRVTLKVHASLTGNMVTGVVAGVIGSVQETGELLVHHLVTLGQCPHPAPHPAGRAVLAELTGSPPPAAEEGGDIFALLVSNLHCGGTQDPLPLHLLTQFIRASAGSAAETAATARIARVIVAGGLVTPRAGSAADEFLCSKHLSADKQAALAAPMAEADALLAAWAAAAPVDVMPGGADATNVTLPQQPMHPVLLPSACRYSSFTSCPNPYDVSLGGVRIAGTSGQTVDDVAAYTRSFACFSALDAGSPEAGGDGVQAALQEGASLGEADPVARLNILANCVYWRHIAPTAPDTLPTYPFYNMDPFVLTQDVSPHVLFAGGQPAYGSALVTPTAVSYDAATMLGSTSQRRQVPTDGAGELDMEAAAAAACPGGVPMATRVLAVPDFAKTSTAVLLNLRTLQCSPVLFAGPAGGGGSAHVASGAAKQLQEAADFAGVTLPGEPTRPRAEDAGLDVVKLKKAAREGDSMTVAASAAAAAAAASAGTGATTGDTPVVGEEDGEDDGDDETPMGGEDMPEDE